MENNFVFELLKLGVIKAEEVEYYSPLFEGVNFDLLTSRYPNRNVFEGLSGREEESDYEHLYFQIERVPLDKPLDTLLPIRKWLISDTIFYRKEKKTVMLSAYESIEEGGIPKLYAWVLIKDRQNKYEYSLYFTKIADRFEFSGKHSYSSEQEDVVNETLSMESFDIIQVINMVLRRDTEQLIDYVVQNENNKKH